MNYILKSESSLYYECGYSSDNALLLKLSNDNYFITDGRYTIEAKSIIKNAKVIESSNIYQEARELIKRSKVKKITFDPKEFTKFEFDFLSLDLKVNFKPEAEFHRIKRAIKSEKEIKLLRKAVNIGKEAFDEFKVQFLDNRDKKIELSEKNLLFWLKSTLSNYGKYDLSFEPIVAFNENSAKPHAIATKKTLKKGDLILIDAGVKYKRYCSDRTRTFMFGSESKLKLKQKFKSREMQKIYDCVLKSHDRAISKAKVGVKASYIDKVAREVIDKAGFAKYFVHSTGHGVGLDIHEYPFISSKSDMIIEENMVFTIEPGIYIPNKFGVRIEDMVVMKNGIAEVL